MEFSARVGILDHEISNAQPIEVDLFLTVARSRGKIDTTGVVDYRHAYSVVSDILMAGHIEFLEEAAERIAAAALALPLVNKVKVAIRKPRVSLPGPLSFAEVSVERRRD